MTSFWTLWTFNAVMALIPIYFFIVGLYDGSISANNIMIWVIILLVVAVVIGGSLLLKSANQMPLARGLLIVAAIPGVIALIFFGIVIIGKPRWN